jgi:hypothetical protein
MDSHPHKYAISISAADLAIRDRELAFFRESCLEATSRHALNSIVRCYSTFCLSARVVAFPLSYRSVGLYYIQYAHRFGHTTRSIPSIASHLKRANRELGHPPMSDFDSACLGDVVTSLRKYDKSEPRRKLPVTHAILQAVQGRADMRSLLNYQLITMGRVAHDALLRGCELIGLKRGHLVWSHDRSQVRVIIHNSKAHKTGGKAEGVILSDYGPSSAVAMLREYWHTMHMDARAADAPLWPSIHHEGSTDWSSFTSKKSFVSAFQVLLSKAGFQASLYSGHSFRSGGATDLWASKVCRPQSIKLFGRWKSEAFWLYVRDNPALRASEVAGAFASLHVQHQPDFSVLAAKALRSSSKPSL